MIPRQAPQVSVKEIDGQFLVLDRPHGKLHELNATASFIWQQCNGQNTAEAIARALAASFEIDPESAVQDVQTILRQFESCHLIQDASSETG